MSELAFFNPEADNISHVPLRLSSKNLTVVTCQQKKIPQPKSTDVDFPSRTASFSPSLHTLPFSLHFLQTHTAVTTKDSIWTGVGVRISISRATTMINIKFKRLMSWSAAPLYSCRWGRMFGC
ncbi:Putative protein of unknown function [Podospora comata]|uniref:Uncharacterized protein n=1 Tax=Podospora comata TaxID=48703 RepID=A0ABY6RY61_PODCO|nr:Putative protein of unknown function [Podospora comata]